MNKLISVIIPTYNEEAVIKEALSSFSKSAASEIIVVDGRSSDKTAIYAKEFPVSIIKVNKGRAEQLNQAARLAKGSVLVFLHADCQLEEGSLEAIENCIAKGFIGGCFKQKIRPSKRIYRFIESSGNYRAKLFKIFYGDQAIFVRRETFFELGGFDQVNLFEDVLFSKKLTKAGKVCVLNKKVYTSDRRWKKQGILKTTFINWLLTLGFIVGVSPQALRRVYHDIR